MTEITTIRGLQEARRRNLERIAAMKPSGRLGATIRDITMDGQRYLVSVTHVDTGAYKASQRADVNGLTGRIYVDPSAVNPKGQRPSIYAIGEEKRGGSHAAYARTYEYIKSRISGHLRAFGAGLR